MKTINKIRNMKPKFSTSIKKNFKKKKKRKISLKTHENRIVKPQKKKY
jgi:hypothetical protein